MDSPLQIAADALATSRHAIALTGAGVSVESGIPDFRSPGGIWDTYPPEEFATREAFLRDPDRVWEMWYELDAMIGKVAPNPAHRALTTLQQRGFLGPIITQNIDNLHQEAGSVDVIEFHGNARQMRCLDCHNTAPLRTAQHTHGAPRCPCGGIMKPDVVLFGELIPERALEAATRAADQADVVLVVGTSATVFPAAAIPVTAKSHGAYIIECNVENSDLSSQTTDCFLQGSAATQLIALAAHLKPR